MSKFNQLVSECLEYAEKQAKQAKQAKRECEMTMKEWNNHIEQLLSEIDDDIESDKKLFSESIDTNVEEEKINDAEHTVNQVENDCLRRLKKIESIVKNRK